MYIRPNIPVIYEFWGNDGSHHYLIGMVVGSYRTMPYKPDLCDQARVEVVIKKLDNPM